MNWYKQIDKLTKPHRGNCELDREIIWHENNIK